MPAFLSAHVHIPKSVLLKALRSDGSQNLPYTSVSMHMHRFRTASHLYPDRKQRVHIPTEPQAHLPSSGYMRYPPPVRSRSHQAVPGVNRPDSAPYGRKTFPKKSAIPQCYTRIPPFRFLCGCLRSDSDILHISVCNRFPPYLFQYID